MDDTIGNKQKSNLLDTNTIISLIKKNPRIDENSEIEIIRHIESGIGDKYIVASANTGTCHRTYLLLLDNSNNIKKCVELEANCDSDLSRASYKYKIYSEESDTVFNVKEITQSAIDSNLIDKNGRLKNGYSLDDVNCRNDTVLRRITFSILIRDTIPQWPNIWKVI